MYLHYGHVCPLPPSLPYPATRPHTQRQEDVQRHICIICHTHCRLLIEEQHRLDIFSLLDSGALSVTKLCRVIVFA